MGPQRFSASKAAQFMACPGSANLVLSIPGWEPPVVDDTAGAKGKGTRIHELFAMPMQELGATDLAHYAAALTYVAKLRSTRRFNVLSEEAFVADWLPSKPQTTVDLVLYTQDELHVLDLKTGKIPVFPQDNDQLMFYLRCVAHLAPKAPFFAIHIVQPWAGYMGGVDVGRATLDDWTMLAIDADTRILAGDTTLNPSDHCTFCPANPHSRGDKGRPLCPKMMQVLYPEYLDEADILTD